MRKPFRFFYCLSLSFLFSASTFASSEDEIENKELFSSDDVVNLFGHQKQYEDPKIFHENLDMDASLSTNMDCGKIGFSTDITATLDKLKKIPENLLKNFSQGGPAIIAAAPMYLLCQMEPNLCAELKNLNLKLDMDIGLQTNVCHSINKFIDDKSEQGKLNAHSIAIKKCVTEHSQGDSSKMLSAMNECEENSNENSGLVTDILKRKLNSASTGTQKVMDSVFKSSNIYDENEYQLLNTLFGEMQIESNGSLRPVIEKNHIVITSDDLSNYFLSKSIQISCDSSRLKQMIFRKTESENLDPKLKYIENIIYHQIQEKISIEDVHNLSDIHEKDRDILCQILGKSIAKDSIEYFSSQVMNSMNEIQKNDFVPESVRQSYSDKTKLFFMSLNSSLKTQEVFPIQVLRSELKQLADRDREENRLVGTSLSKESIRNETIKKLFDGCDSVYSCD